MQGSCNVQTVPYLLKTCRKCHLPFKIGTWNSFGWVLLLLQSIFLYKGQSNRCGCRKVNRGQDWLWNISEWWIWKVTTLGKDFFKIILIKRFRTLSCNLNNYLRLTGGFVLKQPQSLILSFIWTKDPWDASQFPFATPHHFKSLLSYSIVGCC